ncbi:MAG: hypothetical protein Q7J54_00760 [Candidatus Woesearchaeota archaeon]|nr:hypothetical protein [Candidatus Woesearchaeota archaeon]
MKIGISWNETENRFYLTVGNSGMRPVRKKEDIMPYCLNILKNLPYEKIETSLAVSACEKSDIEKIITDIDEVWKKEGQK